MYNGAYGRGDFGNAYLLPCLAALDGGNGGVSGGAIMAKVSHFSTQGRRQTTFGVPCPTVPNRFSFDPFLLGLRDNTEKIYSCACVRTGRGRVERLVPEEELDVIYVERVVGCVSDSLAIFSRMEE